MDGHAPGACYEGSEALPTAEEEFISVEHCRKAKTHCKQRRKVEHTGKYFCNRCHFLCNSSVE